MKEETMNPRPLSEIEKLMKKYGAPKKVHKDNGKPFNGESKNAGRKATWQ